MRVLLTGMSGTGKSTLTQELRRRGYTAYDADEDGFSEPRADGRWGWRADAVAALLAQVADGDLLFFAGCSEEQIELPFDCRVVLTVPEDEIVTRLSTRASNPYGRTPAERRQVLADRAQIEPLLRRSADLVLSTSAPVAEVADRVLGHVVDRASPPRGGRRSGSDAHEEVLAGGNMTAVVRVGDTVRRTAGAWTPTIHAFMRHLRAAGFTTVPEPLGIDDRGREVISLLPGAPATYPMPAFAWSDATLAAVARSLRAFHDASVGFVPPPDGCWQWPAHEPAEVVCHNDFAPYNLMFEDGRLTGVIDLDLASPGPRVWDMAYTAYRFVPLTDPANPDAPFRGAEEQARRLAAFCAAYDHPGVAPSDVLASAAARLRELVAFIERRAAEGDAAQQAVLARGDVQIYRRDIAHIESGVGRRVSR